MKDSKNGYVLFASIDSIPKALELNQSMLGDKHIRVDTTLAPEKEEGKKLQSHDDFKTTIFVGNLPFIVSEEEVRTHFA